MSIKIYQLFLLCVVISAALSRCTTSSSVDGNLNRATATSSRTVEPAPASVDVQAGVVMKSGDVKPIARVEFYLLKENAMTILGQAGFANKGGKPLTAGSLALAQVDAEIASLFDKKEPPPFAKMMAALKNSSKASITTDFEGKGRFANIPPGDYWIFGIAKVGDNAVIWNSQTSTKSGENSLILDQKNASWAS